MTTAGTTANQTIECTCPAQGIGPDWVDIGCRSGLLHLRTCPRAIAAEAAKTVTADLTPYHSFPVKVSARATRTGSGLAEIKCPLSSLAEEIRVAIVSACPQIEEEMKAEGLATWHSASFFWFIKMPEIHIEETEKRITVTLYCDDKAAMGVWKEKLRTVLSRIDIGELPLYFLKVRGFFTWRTYFSDGNWNGWATGFLIKRAEVVTAADVSAADTGAEMEARTVECARAEAETAMNWI